jgi:hypothetical protein
MSGQPDAPNPLDPLNAWRTMRGTSPDAWSKVMLDTVHSDA